MSAEPSAMPREEDVAALLQAAGQSPRFQWEPLPGGANNRVYRVRGETLSALLKVYYRHPDDLRDRLGAEWAFSQFAWTGGLRCLPRPLACDRDRGLGLYEFIEGRPLAPREVGASHVQEALDFYGALNRRKSLAAAGDLPRAAESCFTLDEHLACVARRMAPLAQLAPATALDREAGQWVRGALTPAWKKVCDQVRASAAQWHLDAAAPLAPCDRCISPSDFGFHNALLAADGRLRFFDFEYAGWDDPAKMACDFLCQPALPIPDTCRKAFAEAAVAELADPARHLRRVSLLLPVYCVKWCCIMMNEFLPAGGRRRRFARNARDEDDRKREQLEKARDALTAMDFQGIP